MLNMLDDLIKHYQNTNNQSLLARIYGIFTIKTSVFAPVDVIIMENTAQLQKNKHSSMIFDIKGSIIGRKIKFKDSDERWWTKQLGHKKCMKDNNFIEISRDLNKKLVNFSDNQIKKYKNIIETDSLFLCNHNLMDYSLLMIIEFIEKNQHDNVFD